MFISRRCTCSSKCGLDCCKKINFNSICKDLTLLSVRSRLDILFFLYNNSHCVCDLMSHTDMSQSLISHHLSDLARAGFVKSKRSGKFSDYYLTPKGKKYIKAILVLNKKEKGGVNKHD